MYAQLCCLSKVVLAVWGGLLRAELVRPCKTRRAAEGARCEYRQHVACKASKQRHPLAVYFLCCAGGIVVL
jgi:hypothetical protein